MILWTIQSIEVYEQIQDHGVFHCDFAKSGFNDWSEQFDWLAQEMRARIGNPPDGVTHPIWAWYMWEGIRKKPDLRRERWGNGWKGDRFVCMEIDIPEERLVLTDFDSWSIILSQVSKELDNNSINKFLGKVLIKDVFNSLIINLILGKIISTS